jgi:arylsulfatase A-like enzyme
MRKYASSSVIRSVVFLGLCLCGGGQSVSAEPAKKPNILFIAVDDLNHWVTHLERNHQACTPNIDRLAKQGTSFTRAYCAAPACEPSRAALLSGRRPWTTGCYKNGDKWKQHLTEGQQLPAIFLNAGYHVAGAGKIFHADTFFLSEWSEYMSAEGLSSHGRGVSKDEGFHEPLMADLGDQDLMDWHTVDWCVQRLQTPPDKPLFLACGLHKPHLPFAVPRKYYEAFPLESIELPPYLENDLDDIPPAGLQMAMQGKDHERIQQSGRWQAAIQSYLATCAYTDMNIGRLLDALESSPIRDETIVILWGDHGWSFGEKHRWRKFALWEEPTRTPLIIALPGQANQGVQCNHAVDLMAVYPTLCELAGLEIPEFTEGKSLVSLIENPKAPWSHAAITSHGRGNHAVRYGNWRYIRYADGSEELYDHAVDPFEWKNLAAEGSLEEVKQELAGWLPAEHN